MILTTTHHYTHHHKSSTYIRLFDGLSTLEMSSTLISTLPPSSFFFFLYVFAFFFPALEASEDSPEDRFDDTPLKPLSYLSNSRTCLSK